MYEALYNKKNDRERRLMAASWFNFNAWWKAQPDAATQQIERALIRDSPRRTLCAMRELMMQLHNPAPRARVFGFKEIYSPFVRDWTATGEVMTHGVGFLRTLFPRARFIFHSRRNLSRAADSDFWRRDWRGAANEANHSQRLALISLAVNRYQAYATRHPQHAFVTTLDGLTDRNDTSGEIARLFEFLGEPLTPALKKVARSHIPLYDWVEERHVKLVTVNGTVQRRAFKAEKSQGEGKAKKKKKKKKKSKATTED